MALLWLEGFDILGTSGNAPSPTGIFNRKLAVAGNAGDLQVGHVEDLSWRTSYGYFTTPSLTTNTTLIVGMALYNASLINAQAGVYVDLFSFREATTLSFAIRIKGTSLGAFRGTTALGYSEPGFKLPQNGWCYVECKATYGNTGSFEVRVNGVKVLSSANSDTSIGTQGYWDNVRYGNGSDWYTNLKIDDYYICDATGNTCNDFLGPIQVHTVNPTSDANNDWDAGGYADVDERPVDDNTSTAYTANTGFLEFGCEATNNFTTVYGVACNAMYKTDANTTVALTMNTSNTYNSSANISYNSTNYVTKVHVRDTDPTGNAWTVNTVNSTAFGIEVK